MEKAERRALLGFVLISWLALGVRPVFWYKSRRMYVTEEHLVPVAWLFESLETVRSSPSNRKRLTRLSGRGILDSYHNNATNQSST